MRGWVDSALDHLLGTTSEAAETRARSVARLEHVDALTHDQAALLTFAAPNRRYEISGSAGTGKTWLAMEQARRWAEDGERVCFVSYGRGVAEYVRRATSDFRRPLSFVGTFHQLGFTWGVQAGTDADAAFWEEEAPRLMLPAAAALPDSDRFTAFVVDEAQDFADAWWPALLQSGTPDYRLAVLRDDEQAVFTSRRGRPEVPLTPFALRENLRNPVQVVDTFRPLIAAAVDARGGDGFPVEFRPCEADDVIAAADEAVESLLDDHGWLPEDIAVLTTAHRHPVQLESAGDKSAYWDDFFGPGVFYSTVAGFKGLERPVVVLAVDGFHAGVDPHSVLYAGMSRARDLLVVVGPEDGIEAAAGAKVLRRLRRR